MVPLAAIRDRDPLRIELVRGAGVGQFLDGFTAMYRDREPALVVRDLPELRGRDRTDRCPLVLASEDASDPLCSLYAKNTTWPDWRSDGQVRERVQHARVGASAVPDVTPRAVPEAPQVVVIRPDHVQAALTGR